MICLNILGEPQVFVAIAALIVIVLLVWAQLYTTGSKDPDKNINFWCGITWTNTAIFFVLIAVGLYVLLGRTNDWAKGFLALSFLMTVTDILIYIFISIFNILLGKPANEPLTKAGKNYWKRTPWIFGWVFWGFGLGCVSFHIAGLIERLWFYIGKFVLLALIVITICWAMRIFIREIYASIRRCCRWKKLKKGNM
jgi:hypothetical protein